VTSAEHDELLASVRAIWPGVHVDDDTLLAYLRARERSLDDVHVSDLYLACACARSDAAALREFEATYMPIVRAGVGHMRLDAAQIDEVAQRVRERLFVAEPGQEPKIKDYSGAGELGSWLRIMAVRIALRMVQKNRELPLEDEQLMALEAPQQSLPLDAAMREAFVAAFKEALASLSSLEKTVLRQHYIDHVTLDELGELHQAHRTTVARWLREAREALLARTRKLIMQRTRASTSACDSVIRQARSQLELTLGSFFS
jgi:RNA polymerase sigma-70 factor, ECF subfamily